MVLARSRVTKQGQVSVPVEVRRRLGVGPGSVLEWDEGDDVVVVRRAGKYTFEDIRKTLFKRPPKRATIEEMDEGIRRYMRQRHARR